MRIISGSAGGMKLFAPAGLNTRPTTDRVRESVFNIIADEIFDAGFLDLYGGTGANGLEAVSRGAAKAVIVELSSKCAEIIKRNITKTGFDGQAEILIMDAVKAVSFLDNKGLLFDVIYMDPPFGKNLALKTLREIAASHILAENGVIIAEHGGDETLADIDGFEIYKRRKYGASTVDFLRKART